MPPLVDLPLLLLALAPFGIATSNLPFDCADRHQRDDDACSKPIADIEPISNGAYYFAKVPCLDCPYIEHDRKNLDGSRTVLEGDNDLVSAPCPTLLAPYSTRLFLPPLYNLQGPC